MIAKPCNNLKNVFGYNLSTDQDENNADVLALYKLASKNRTKLVVFGGLHGLDPTGEPSGQMPSEKTDIYQGDATVEIGGKTVTSFALDDVALKSGNTSINFVYKNLATQVTKGSDMTTERQQDTKILIQQYHRGGYYVLLSWCFSRTWANSIGL